MPAAAGVSETVQAEVFGPVEASTQGVPLNASLPELVRAIVPVGLEAVPAVSMSVTVTVTELAWFTTTVDGLRLIAVLVVRVFTVCETPAEVLVLKFESPAYFAVSVLVPAAAGVSEQLPVPPLSVTWQVSPAPSSTVTVPVGVPWPGKFTVTETLIVTAWFTTDGFGVFAVIVVVVSALFTVSAAVLLLPECTRSAG